MSYLHVAKKAGRGQAMTHNGAVAGNERLVQLVDLPRGMVLVADDCELSLSICNVPRRKYRELDRRKT